MLGGAGQDHLEGDDGDDDIDGGDDDDDIEGGNGNDNCNGGDGDDSILDTELKARLTGATGTGKAEFEQGFEDDGTPEEEFEVKLKGVPVGTYDVLIDGMNVGQVVVTLDDDGSTEGELELEGMQVPAVIDGSLIVVLDSMGNTILQGTFMQD